MSVTIMKSLNKTIVDQLKQLEIESCNNGEISLKLELDYKLRSRQQETENNEFLYYEGNQIVGYLGILSFGNTAEITGMVHPAFRRNGIFTELLEAASKEMESRKYSQILLLTDEKSISGRGFINSHGGLYINSEYEMTFTDNPLLNLPKLTLKPAGPSDFDDIRHIDEKCFGESNSIDLENTYVAYHDGTMIAKVRLELYNDEGGIFGLGVLPEFRNQGYGKGLLENSIFELKKQGAKKIFLQVVTENENALGLYLHTGFTIDNCMEYYQI